LTGLARLLLAAPINAKRLRPGRASLPYRQGSCSLYQCLRGVAALKSAGIMSMQRIYNYGSSLQGYGLKRLVEGLTRDIRVSFVDYVPGDVLVPGGGGNGSTSRLERAMSKLVEYNDVDAKFADKVRFFNHKRTYGKRYFPLLGVPPRPNHDLNLDVQIIGSDEVFNCVQSNTRVGYSRDLFGHRSPAKRLISYAGSFGNTTLEKIETFGIRANLEEDLSRFEAISVRDRNSAQIVEKLTGREPTLNVDPALAYDFMHLEDRIPKARQYDGKYLVVYGYSGRLDHQENSSLRDFARTIGARILCFGGVQECCDEFIDCSPFQLLAYFRDAEAVVTDTFHGTIFAIINNKPFATIIRPSSNSGYGNEEKLGFLLETLGLESQRVTEFVRVGEILGNEIDFGSLNEMLARERSRSLEYLASTVL
jgi:hypothetical protein